MFDKNDVEAVKYSIDILEDQVANGSQLESTQRNLERMRELLNKVEMAIVIPPKTVVLQSILFEHSVVKETISMSFEELAGKPLVEPLDIVDSVFFSLWNAVTSNPDKAIDGIGKAGDVLDESVLKGEVDDTSLKTQMVTVENSPNGLLEALLAELRDSAGDDEKERIRVAQDLSQELKDIHQALCSCEL